MLPPDLTSYYPLNVIYPHGGAYPWWSLHDSPRKSQDTEILRSSYKPNLYVAADRMFHRKAPLFPTELRQCLVLPFPEIQSVFRYYRELYLVPNTDWINGGLTPGSVRDVTAMTPEGAKHLRHYPGQRTTTMDIPEFLPGEDRVILPEEYGPLAFMAAPLRWRQESFNPAGDFNPEWIEDSRNACQILLRHGTNSTSKFDFAQNGVGWLQGIADILRNRYGGDWGI